MKIDRKEICYEGHKWLEWAKDARG